MKMKGKGGSGLSAGVSSGLAELQRFTPSNPPENKKTQRTEADGPKGRRVSK